MTAASRPLLVLPSSIYKAALCYSYSTDDSDPTLIRRAYQHAKPLACWRIAFLPTRALAKSGRDEMAPPSGSGHYKPRCAPGSGGPSLSNVGPLAYVLRRVLSPRRFRIPQGKPRPPLASRERATALLTVARRLLGSGGGDTQKKRAAQPHSDQNCALTLTPA